MTATGRTQGWKRLWLLAFAAMAVCAQASAQIVTRAIPEEAKRATIRHVQDMVVSLDGTPVQLAPGGLIRDRSNLIIVPSALPQDGTAAAYVLDAGGQVSRVWLLTDEEAARGRSFFFSR